MTVCQPGVAGSPEGASRPAAAPVQRRPPHGPDPARRAALDLLAAVRERGAYANLLLPALLRQRRITGRDAALATELGYGACRAAGLLDAVLQACTDRPLHQVDGDLADALRLGAYQLLRTRIPSHAAVSATVELVRAARGRGAAGFANAVLRRVAGRDEAAWVRELAPDADTDPIGHLAFAHAHPRWIAEAFDQALRADPVPGDSDHAAGGGWAELAAALAASDERPAVHLAARPGAISAAELAAVTGGEPAPYSPYGVRLGAAAARALGYDGEPGAPATGPNSPTGKGRATAGGPAAAGLDVLREGLATVQDEGSQLVTLALAAAPLAGGPDQGRWLDLCAGPGGKAVLLGALVGLLGGTLDAVERAEHRARLVERACQGLPVRVHVADGRDSGLPAGSFDRVLVDVPCSGLGALRRRPEARWRRDPGDLPELTRLQRELLAAGLRLVRPGGVVGYVTCSPHRAETVDVVAAAAGATPLDARPLLAAAQPLGTAPLLGAAQPLGTAQQLGAAAVGAVPLLGAGPYVQLWPHRHGTDAMFCALLRRG
jgi:16S rRNA (cytosine967-C5)-methyltransferase